jgi:hypothetical protein
MRGQGKRRRWNYLITFFWASEGVLSEAKFLHGINALGKIFLETLFKQNFGFDGTALRWQGFFAGFLRGDFYGVKSFTGTFLRYKTEIGNRELSCGGAVSAGKLVMNFGFRLA